MRKVSELERCALTLLHGALENINYLPLRYAIGRFLEETGSDTEGRWDLGALHGLNALREDLRVLDRDQLGIEKNWWYEDFVRSTEESWGQWKDDTPTIAHMYAIVEREGNYHKLRLRAMKRFDTAAYYLMGDIILYRQSFDEVGEGERSECISTMGQIYLTTSLAANIVEYHNRCMDAQSWMSRAYCAEHKEDGDDYEM